MKISDALAGGITLATTGLGPIQGLVELLVFCPVLSVVFLALSVKLFKMTGLRLSQGWWLALLLVVASLILALYLAMSLTAVVSFS